MIFSTPGIGSNNKPRAQRVILVPSHRIQAGAGESRSRDGDTLTPRVLGRQVRPASTAGEPAASQPAGSTPLLAYFVAWRSFAQPRRATLRYHSPPRLSENVRGAAASCRNPDRKHSCRYPPPEKRYITKVTQKNTNPDSGATQSRNQG